MRAKRRCNRDGSQRARYSFNPVTPASVGRSRPALLASGSLIALAALGAPSASWASCNGKNQTISSPSTPGPIFGKGGNVTVNAGASIAGGPTGVYARNCGIGALTNRGSIGAGAGAFDKPGGIGVRANSDQTIDLLSNARGATITGGTGGGGFPTGKAGGAGVSNAGTIITLINRGTIGGGRGGSGRGFSSNVGGAGGAGVSNGGTVTSLSNSAAIVGGAGSAGFLGAGNGGAGVANSGTIGSLLNSGTIAGGAGGADFWRQRIAARYRRRGRPE